MERRGEGWGEGMDRDGGGRGTEMERRGGSNRCMHKVTPLIAITFETGTCMCTLYVGQL